jgi:asparagine synthase (glutamine-hydrolysing)
MCGIAGMIRLAGSPPIDEALARRMADIIAHRGPDDSGVYIAPDGCAALANRRLAIIDLSPAGHMPMSSDTGRLTITYNGEIYNHADYRPELEARGHVFRGHSDTEVIVRLYEEYGPEALNRLRGMFAIAIGIKRNESCFWREIALV